MSVKCVCVCVCDITAEKHGVPPLSVMKNYEVSTFTDSLETDVTGRTYMMMSHSFCVCVCVGGGEIRNHLEKS